MENFSSCIFAMKIPKKYPNKMNFEQNFNSAWNINPIFEKNYLQEMLTVKAISMTHCSGCHITLSLLAFSIEISFLVRGVMICPWPLSITHCIISIWYAYWRICPWKKMYWPAFKGKSKKRFFILFSFTIWVISQTALHYWLTNWVGIYYILVRTSSRKM